jgi:general secretion pathway protein D
LNNLIFLRLRLIALCVPVVFFLASCDTMDGLAKKNASASVTAKSSDEAQARMEAVRQRDAEVVRLVREGEKALKEENADAAEEAYRALENLEPGNLRAAEGLRRVAAARRHAELLEEARELMGSSDAGDDQAARKLHEILLENPGNVIAGELYQSLIAKQDAKQEAIRHKKLVYKNPVTLEFRDVSLKVIIEALARNTGINFIVDKDVASGQKATLFVKSVSLEDALDLLVQTNQLQKKVLSETSVIIYPNTPLKQREYQELSIRTFFLEYADVKQVSGLLKSMLNVKQIQTDERLSMIVLKDTPEVLALAEKLIASQDLPESEVMMELEVLDVQRTKLEELGINWPNNVTMTTGIDPLTLKQLININNSDIKVLPLSATIHLQKDLGDVNVLANPRIRVKSKEKAKIHIGDKVPVITSNVTSTGVTSENIQYIDTGLKLEVEPNISQAGDVTIRLSLDVSTLGAPTKTSNGTTAYVIGTRSTSTLLRLKDGETQILAGLISDADRKTMNKLPGLSSLPLLGRLFADDKNESQKTEIMLSITPHIVRERKQPEAGLVEYWSGTEAQTGGGNKAPMTREGISKMFGVPAAPPPPVTPPAAKQPQGINIPLPPGMASGLESGPGSPAQPAGE